MMTDNRSRIDARTQARVAQRIPAGKVDWRYYDFNLETETGKQGFQARVERDMTTYKQRYGLEFSQAWGSALADYQRQRVISSTQESIAKSIISDLLK